MLTFGTFALLMGFTSFAEIFAFDRTGEAQLAVVLLLAAYILVKITITESGRIPVDDPARTSSSR